MHPELFELFGIHFYTFGLLIAMGFLSAAFWIMYRAKDAGEPETLYAESTLWLIVSGLLGAKLFYFLFFPHQFLADPMGALMSSGGLVWYGGLVAVVMFVWVFTRLHRISFMSYADLLAPPAALGLAIGRLGCLMAGCCYGGASALPWAIQYPLGHQTHPLHVHPSPVYETMMALVLMAGLLVFEKRQQVLGFGRGAVGALFLMGYGFIRFVLEYFRGDRLVWFEPLNLSASQLISVVGVLAGLAMLLYTRKQAKKSVMS